MSSGHAEEDPAGAPLPRVRRMNYLIRWGGNMSLRQARPAEDTTISIHPAYGHTALTQAVSLEAEAAAEAAQLSSFNELAALMEEAPGA